MGGFFFFFGGGTVGFEIYNNILYVHAGGEKAWSRKLVAGVGIEDVSLIEVSRKSSGWARKLSSP